LDGGEGFGIQTMKSTRTFFALSFLMLALTACLVAGCEKKSPGSGISTPPDNPEKIAAAAAADLQQRYQAAAQINDISKRDNALDAVAGDAAKAGFGDTAKKAIMGINSIGGRDASASACAVALAKAGKRADANAVAQLINNIALRDSTLAKLAGE
jgi:hypothetical protein